MSNHKTRKVTAAALSAMPPRTAFFDKDCDRWETARRGAIFRGGNPKRCTVWTWMEMAEAEDDFGPFRVVEAT